MPTNTPLVSIIIPTFNRAHLIGETLNSVLAQTYTNWECIVVDDGSSDNTAEVIATYLAKDNRFHYHHRPKDRLPGGNAARNYGLEVSKGEYIQWFDSDDLMLPDFLFQKLEAMEREKADFVISKSSNFDEHGTYEVKKYIGISKFELSADNFILGKVYWITQDFFIKKELIGNCKFNEHLRSGQETNFFIVLLSNTKLNGFYIDQTLSLRRIHESSIQQNIKKNRGLATKAKLLSWVLAYYEINNKVNKQTNRYLLNEIIMIFYGLKMKYISPSHFFRFSYFILKYKGILKGLAFIFSMIINILFNRGYNLICYARS